MKQKKSIKPFKVLFKYIPHILPKVALNFRKIRGVGGFVSAAPMFPRLWWLIETHQDEKATSELREPRQHRRFCGSVAAFRNLPEKIMGKSWKIMENHGHNNYGIFWPFYGDFRFK